MNRREFLKTAAILTAGIFLPTNIIEAKPKLKTLDELEIETLPLEFGEMDIRTHTGAIVIHHTGMRNTDMTVADIHDLHVNGNHWSGIGYHFVIHKDGIISSGRPLEYLGAHALSNNEFTVGVCLTGNYNLGKPPIEQLNSAVELVAALCDKYKFEPTDTTIFGHRDFGGISCPGDNLYKLLPNIIKEANYLL